MTEKEYQEAIEYMKKCNKTMASFAETLKQVKTEDEKKDRNKEPV